MAGGSGIAPIFHTLASIADMKDDKIELILLFANKHEEDIVLARELEDMAQRVRVIHILSRHSAAWKGLQGHINHQILKDICPLDDPATLYVHCGPFGLNKAIRKIFSEQYPDSAIFKF